WLYVRNFFPGRWPGGDPDFSTTEEFGDIDSGPTKTELLANRSRPKFVRPFHLATDKRPAEELYDTVADPHNLTNLAGNPSHAQIRTELANLLQNWMLGTADPRGTSPRTTFWDNTEYFGAG
ncbi:MAG: hypothetical protein H0V07_04945, partial [Propionibacteriales bacterium]|nr:hypothetical protein [Propionibacteriales bacterium]